MGGFEETKKSGRTRSSKNQITSIISAFKFVGGLSMGNFSNLWCEEKGGMISEGLLSERPLLAIPELYYLHEP